MSSLHHDRRVDDGRGVASAAPAETLAPAREDARRSAAAVDGTIARKVRTQRQGNVSRAGRTSTGPAEPVKASGPRATPYPRKAPVAPDERADAVAPVVTVEPVVDDVPAFVDEALAGLQTDPAETVRAIADGRRARRWRHRSAFVRSRPAFYLAAGLVGALSLGALVDTDPTAHADTAAVTRSVSVAEQLGIEAEPAPTLSDAASTRMLQELVVSRNERDTAQTAAADAQAAADVFALAAAAEAFEAARPKAVLPVDGARLSSTFGARWGTVHAGIDLAAPMRTPEKAVMDGVVLEAGPASGFGLVVYIQHDDGDVSVYGHMDKILVEPGQLVRAGETIALLGNRGESTGPHLHFEVHSGGLDGTRIDPLPWFRERGVQI